MPRVGSVCEDSVWRVPKPTSVWMSLWIRRGSISRSIARSAGDGAWGCADDRVLAPVDAADAGTAAARAAATTTAVAKAVRRTWNMVPPSVGWQSHTHGLINRCSRMSDNETAVIGVDVGTTSAKAVAFDAAGRALGAGEAGYPLLEPEPGQAVQDPGAVMAGMVAAIRAAAAAARGRDAGSRRWRSAARCTRCVALDGDGQPLTAIVTWGDMRAAEQAERLRASTPSCTTAPARRCTRRRR